MITSALRVKTDSRGANTTVSMQWDPLTPYKGAQPRSKSEFLRQHSRNWTRHFIIDDISVTEKPQAEQSVV